MLKQTATRIAYLRVMVFAVAAFIFNTTEFIPVALLSDIGAGFGLPVAQVGLMMTVYAWTVSLMSLPFMLLTARMERRRLLLILFAVFVGGHLLSVAAWNFEVLVLSRIVIALAHAVFWSVTSALVMRVAPKGKKAQALGLLSVGTSMAMVLGLPLGRIVGQLTGWRTTFALIALAAAAVMVLMYRLLPRLESRNSGSLKSVPELFKRPLLVGIYGLVVLAVTAHFTAYSYIEPFMLHVARMGAAGATAVLLVSGVSGMVAGWLFGRVYSRRPNGFLAASLLGLTASLLLLVPLSAYPAAVFALVFCWGLAVSCLALSMMMRVLEYASDATDVASAIYSGIFNIGIGGGALLGGIVMRQSADGLLYLGWTGAALAALGMVLFVGVQRRFGSSTP